MKLSTCTLLAAVLLARARTAEAKAYKGAEVYSLQSVLYGRMEMRMRMIRGSGLLSTFFTYKNGSELSRHDLGRDGHRSPGQERREDLAVEPHHREPADDVRAGVFGADARSPTAITRTRSNGRRTTSRGRSTARWCRKTEGGQASSLINAETLRFNAWASSSTGWAGALDEAALPAYQFVNWIKYYRYDNGQFVLDWTDDFDSFDSTRWATGNWTFDGNLVDFDPANAVVQDGTLILAITKEGATGFSGTVPVGRRQHQPAGWRRDHLDAGFRLRLHDRRIAAAWHRRPLRDAACARPRRGPPPPATRRLPAGFLRSLAVSKPGLTLAALLLGVLAPSAASAMQSAELYRTQAYFYGRFEARVRYAPGEGVVSSFFLWKDGSSSTTSWNELDYEKINSDCRLQTNIWTGKGTQSAADQHAHVQHLQRLPHVRVRVDAGLHRLVHRRHADPEGDGRQRHRVHAERVAGHDDPLQRLGRRRELRRRPSIASTLPVRQYISWVQYSSYANGAFQMQWREEFNGSTTPSGWDDGELGVAVQSLDAQSGQRELRERDRRALHDRRQCDRLHGNTSRGHGGRPAERQERGGRNGGSGAGGAGPAARDAGGAGGTTGGGGRGGAAGSASAGSGGTSSTGSGGSGAREPPGTARAARRPEPQETARRLENRWTAGPSGGATYRGPAERRRAPAGGRQRRRNLGKRRQSDGRRR